MNKLEYNKLISDVVTFDAMKVIKESLKNIDVDQNNTEQEILNKINKKQMEQKFLYSGYVFLYESDKEYILSKLKEMNIPIYDNMFLHHCTIQFGKDTLDEKSVGGGYMLRISEVVWNDNCVCLVVENAKLSENTHPHITVCTDVNTKPVFSNTLLLHPLTFEAKRKPFKYSFYTTIQKIYQNKS